MPTSSDFDDDDAAAFRAALRTRCLAAREVMDAAARAACEARIAAHLAALLGTLEIRTLGFCWPIRGEPDVRAVVADWLHGGAGRVAALPVIVAPRSPMRFRAWRPGAAMVTERFGISVPAEGAWCAPDALLLPLAAFDDAGYRLGYGAGYFDRTIAAADPAPLCIGLGFELARVPSIAPQPHDAPLDWVVTENGAERTGPRAG